MAPVLVREYRAERKSPSLTHFVHKDHLGSTAAITDETGAVVEYLAYDPWGKRRHPDGADDPMGAIASLTDRDFTGHEPLEEVGFEPSVGSGATSRPSSSQADRRAGDGDPAPDAEGREDREAHDHTRVSAICATAIYAFAPSIRTFRSGRDFAVWVGLPRDSTRLAARHGWGGPRRWASETSGAC